MKTEMTKRFYENIELRALSEEDEAIIEGMPIVFNQVTHIGPAEGGWDEVIRSSALVNADMSDVVLTIEHNGSKIPLARTKKGRGTMTLEKTPEGVKMRAVLDVKNNAEARALYSAIERGDLDKMSFLFIIRDGGDSWEYKGDQVHREIFDIAKLLDVSVVARPAYDGTEVQLSRSEVDAREEAVDAVRKKEREEVEALRIKNRIIARR